MSTKIKPSSFVQFLSILLDLRKLRNQFYSLGDIVSIAIFAAFCDYEDWEDVSFWTQDQLPWL